METHPVAPCLPSPGCPGCPLPATNDVFCTFISGGMMRNTGEPRNSPQLIWIQTLAASTWAIQNESFWFGIQSLYRLYHNDILMAYGSSQETNQFVWCLGMFGAINHSQPAASSNDASYVSDHVGDIPRISYISWFMANSGLSASYPLKSV